MSRSGTLILLRGAGDVASAVGRRLFLAGFKVAMTELPEPLAIRRTVSFSEAVFEGQTQVEGVEARLAQMEEILHWPFHQTIAVTVDPEGKALQTLLPEVLIDARLLKRRTDTRMDQAPVVGVLGPGYQAGVDCTFVVETKRGHHLGRVIYEGCAEPNTGEPAPVLGYSKQRAIYSTESGRFEAFVEIGNSIARGARIGCVGKSTYQAEISGTVRGLLRSGQPVEKRVKIADIDPRDCASFCYSTSDRSNAIAGGVLEGVLARLGS